MEAHITEAELLELDGLIDQLTALMDRLNERDVHCGLHVTAWADNEAGTIACVVAARGCMPHTGLYLAQHLRRKPVHATAVMLSALRTELDPTWPNIDAPHVN